MDKELHEITPGEIIQHPRFVDKLVKAWYKDGTESWLLIHIEVQWYRDSQFAERMFTYFYKIRDRYKREVTSLAIFTDNDAKYHPNKFEYHCCGTNNWLNLFWVLSGDY
ncbi:RpnC/YadD family protein [Filimonas lacunae]|nr:hypothetical protein [Filimonas lacunae]